VAKPDRFERALTHHRAGRLVEAAAIYQEILRKRPEHAGALEMLAVIAYQAGEVDRAVDLARRAARHADRRASVHNLLGLALSRNAQDAEAAGCFRRAIELGPCPDFYVNLPHVLVRQKKFDEAVAACREALDRYPDDSRLHTNLGDVLQTRGRSEEAIAAYGEAVRLDARCHAAWYSLGCAWLEKDEDATALACFEKAAAIAPEHAPSQHNLGKALYKLGLTDESLERFRTAISLGEGFLPRTAIVTAIPGSPSADHQAVLEARRQWAETHLPPPDPAKVFLRDPSEGRPLRIGYISSFFHSRNWMKPVWGLVNHHDRQRFRVYLFSDAPESACGGGYSKHPTDQFHDILALSNVAAAERIEACGLDILVDLNSFSHVSRLAVLALTPAPIQVAWFNLYATSGMACYDYLVGDEHVIQSEEEEFYTEKVLRLPGCYLSFEVSYPVPDVVDPPVLAAGGLTFGCLASQYKITPQVVETWSEILHRAPGTRLFLKNSTLGRRANCEFLFRRFEQHGVARERIEVEGPSEHFDFLAAYGHIDVALDTFPYNGGTTTSEALWQGVPVLTFRGDRWAARQSTSILREGGLEEFIASDRDDYVNRAVALALAPDTPSRLTELRRNMRSRLAQSPLCDTGALAKHMEGLYVRMFEEWYRQKRTGTAANRVGQHG
jgi:predicted O-linked N-acetylglucosamine transferase (SPINDLY family)